MNSFKMFFGVAFLCLEITKVSGQYYDGNQQQMGDPNQYNQMEKIYPKTPEASSFEKFVNIPQGNYSGIHGFSVPIYSINIKKESFPISIDYHGMGVNVNEIAGTVGIGWNLNIGGVSFSHEVRGYDDFTSIKIEPADGFLNYGGVTVENGDDEFENVMKITGGYDAIHGQTPRSFEMNPDYFSYSLLNNSGKFIIDGERKFITTPKDEIKIEEDGANSSRQFILTDKKGVKYVFEGYINSNTRTNLSPIIESYAYALTSIYFPETGKTMNFTYIDTDYNYISNYGKQVEITNGGSNLCGYFGYVSNETQSVTATEIIKEKLIESITYENTLIQFFYLTGRDDLGGQSVGKEGGKRLHKIIVYNILENASPVKVKEYEIETSINGDGFHLSGTPFIGYGTLKARMWLDSVKETLSGSLYSFDYDGREELPKRFSQRTDWWGSYNGPVNSSDLPSYEYHTHEGHRKYHFGANKEPNETYAVKGALKRVHLPTGGYQEYEYELDEYRFEDEETEYEEQFFEFSPATWSDDSPNQILTLPISNPDFREGFDYRLSFATNHINCDFNPPWDLPNGPRYEFTIYESSNGNDTEFYYGIMDGYTLYQLPEFDINKTYYMTFTKYAAYNPQCPDPDPNHPVIITPQINWVSEKEVYKENKKAGHLRVASITLKDSDGNSKIKRSYEYKNLSDEDRSLSSGKYTGLPLYFRQTIMNSGEEASNPQACQIPPLCSRTLISTNPGLYLNSSYGKSVFYENVTEYYEDLENSNHNYAEEIVFQMPSEEGFPNFDTTPVLYRPHNEYTGGQILEKRLYNENYNSNTTTNQSSMVKKIINTYSPQDFHFNSESSYAEGNSAYIGYGLGAALMYRYGVLNGMCQYYYGHSTNSYLITSGWIKLMQTKEETYENGVLKMTNTTEYEYSPTYAHLNPVKIINTNSLGETLTTEYQYPQDLPGRPNMSTLVSENRISDPVVTKTYNNVQTTPLSISETVYEDFDPSGNTQVLPKYVFAKKNSQTLNYSPTGGDLKISYERYDAQGNLEQYRLADGTPVSIIWGYNGQYPIAKVEGVAYTDIETEANLLAANNNLTESSFNTLRGIVNASNKFGMLTCYIYEPLVGVKMIIQPNGQKEIYEYDPAGRLMKVKDQDGKELKKIDYHYSTQP